MRDAYNCTRRALHSPIERAIPWVVERNDVALPPDVSDHSLVMCTVSCNSRSKLSPSVTSRVKPVIRMTRDYSARSVQRLAALLYCTDWDLSCNLGADHAWDLFVHAVRLCVDHACPLRPCRSTPNRVALPRELLALIRQKRSL